MLIKLLKILIKFLFYIFIYPLKFFATKRNIIMMNSFHPNVYCDNTKYLFEYLSKHTDYEIYWITKNKRIFNYLNKNNYNCIDISKNLGYVYYLFLIIQSKIIIESGTKFASPINLKLNKTIKITTFHGNGPKTVATPKMTVPLDDGSLKTIYPKIKEISNINKFDYVNFTSNFMVENSAQNQFEIPKEKIIKFGSPRCDQFFNINYIKEKYNEKSITNNLLTDGYNGTGRVILYTPTWRPYEYDLPLFELEGLNSIHHLNKYLNDNDIYFFYSIHSAFNAPKKLPSTNRIIFIDNINKHHFYDTNAFMLETDILINDYSNTSTDFAILNRPQIFFMPDYDRYLKEKGFLEDYKSILPGKEISDFKDFTSTIDLYISNVELYRSDYKAVIDKYMCNYYDLNEGNSCELFTSFINSLVFK